MKLAFLSIIIHRLLFIGCFSSIVIHRLLSIDCEYADWVLVLPKEIEQPDMSYSPEPTFTILYFAAASTYTNKTSELLPAPLSVRSLFSTLESRYPGINAQVLKSCAVTINLEYVDSEDDDTSHDSSTQGAGAMIQAGDEVGIIPPVSSG